LKVAEDESKLRACNLIYEYDGPASEDIALRIHSQYAEASRDVNKKVSCIFLHHISLFVNSIDDNTLIPVRL